MRIGVALVAAVLLATGCGSGVFNPAFVNTLVGGVVPVTPGPAAAFVLVRCVNETNQGVEFIVTIEREVLVLDEDGDYQVDDDGNWLTETVRRTVRLTTQATGTARELGTLFPCDTSPVTYVGLGENLLPTDAAVYVGGEGTGGAAGYGVAAGDLNPLQLAIGNFNCGDTIIFRAYQAIGVAGGVGLQSLLLPGSEQPESFSGPSTFENLERFLEEQVRENEP
jgi:hypothetical protein